MRTGVKLLALYWLTLGVFVTAYFATEASDAALPLLLLAAVVLLVRNLRRRGRR